MKWVKLTCTECGKQWEESISYPTYLEGIEERTISSTGHAWSLCEDCAAILKEETENSWGR